MPAILTSAVDSTAAGIIVPWMGAYLRVTLTHRTQKDGDLDSRPSSSHELSGL